MKEIDDNMFRFTVCYGYYSSGYIINSSAFLSKEGCLCYLKDTITTGMKLEKNFTAYFWGV